MPEFHEEKTKRKIELLRHKEEEESVKLLSKKYKIPAIDLSLFPIDTDALALIPEATARLGKMAAIQVAGKSLKVAVQNPEKEETKAALKRLAEQGFRTELYLASGHSMERAWAIYQRVKPEKKTEAGTIQVSDAKVAELQGEIKSIAEVKAKIEQSFSSRTTELLEIIVAGALATDASDVHIEPQEGAVRLRLRLDGVLYDAALLPQRPYALLLSRIKLISELKLNVHDRAQDGRFTIKTPSADIEVRTSTLPGPYGENVVLRVLNPKSILVRFEDLGMQPWVSSIMRQELNRPNGMIVTTGPTGSGKTTTLYTFVRTILDPGTKIITIEDPIEYHLAGIEQTQVDPDKGYDFANGLRAIVRQDPDVILVGEIRDLKTAETAMHASLTGHLVFSTLHTNNAAGTIPRLLDLGVKPSIIAPAINVAMAQRLVRMLCAECRVPAKPSPSERQYIAKTIASLPKKITPPPEKEWTIFRANAKGCASCGRLGRRGRIGIFEIILVDDPVEELISREPTETDIKKQALRQGQTTMQQDGLLKVLSGVTDFEETARVLG